MFQTPTGQTLKFLLSLENLNKMTTSGQFFYTPTIQVLIARDDKTVIDVSDDIVSFELIRNVNAISEFSCMLNNKSRKYNIDSKLGGRINTMDRIIVYMSRTGTPLQVFSGYVVKAPIFNLLPNSVEIRARCTIKRLENTYWDATYPTFQALIPGLLSGITDTKQSSDGGTTAGIANLLVKVAGWDPAKIHIQQIPPTFMSQVLDTLDTVSKTLPILSTAFANAVNANGKKGGNGSSPSDKTHHVIPKNVPTNVSSNWAWGQTVLSLAGLPITNTTKLMMAKWMYREQGTDWAHNNNPLNYGLNSYDDLMLSAIDTAKALRPDTAGWIHYYNGIFDAFKDPNATEKTIAQALVDSIWDGGGDPPPKGHYGGDPSSITNIDTPPLLKDPNASGNDPTNGAQSLSSTPGDTGLNTAGQFAAQAIIQAARSQIGVPYVWGGSTPEGGFDCSGLIDWAFNTGAQIPLPHSANDIYLLGPSLPAGTAPQPGDLLFSQFDSSGKAQHVALVSDNTTGPNGLVGKYIAAPGTGQSVGEWDLYQNQIEAMTRPLALQSQYATGSLGLTVSGNSNNTSANTSGGPSLNINETFNTIFTLPQFNPAAIMTYGSNRAFISDESLLNSISQLVTATMRCYQSAGNGDFVCWFPDYFGHYGTAATMDIKNIEVISLEINHSDDYLVTHMAAIGDTVEMGQGVASVDIMDTQGIVSVQEDAIMKLLFFGATDKGTLQDLGFDAQKFLTKYGMRPFISQQPLIRSHLYEFSYALAMFMQKWSEQYNTLVELTFMPEIYPGMRLRFSDIFINNNKNDKVDTGGNLEVYVQSVSHQGTMSTGFTTSVTVTAPCVNGKMLNYGFN